MKKSILLPFIALVWVLNIHGQESEAIINNELIAVKMSTAVIQNSINNSLDVLLYSSFGTGGPNLNYPLTFKGDDLEGLSTEGGVIYIDDNSTPLDLTDDLVTYTPPKGFSGNDLIIYHLQDYYGNVKEGQIAVKVYGTNSKDVIDLNLQNSKFKIDVYPNPSKGSFILLMNPADVLEMEINIFDVMGKLVFSQSVNSALRVQNISLHTGLASGLYILKTFSSNKLLSSKKILIQ